MAPKLSTLVSRLSRRGPHRVLRGDLAFAGLPGIVCTPQEGLGLPAVAFGHGWMTRPVGYLQTLAHLASWGIVAAAPATQCGPVPSHLALASDLSTTLDICTGVRLGPGEISVHPDRLALAGHGMGAGAAVLTAARRPVSAVVPMFPAPTTPRASTVAASLSTPALILASPSSLTALDSDAVALASAWGGAVDGKPALLRTLAKSDEGGLVEGRRALKYVGLPGTDRGTQRLARVLLTGFLLYHLTDDKDYAPFADPDVVLPKTHPVDLDTATIEPGDQLAELLGR
ncbi:hypothetical protein G4X40_02350 [Rhodococcus sp. D2-41]|uniref:Alpha/beta hydrolase n=1 Tax=Speluncibacter jeojiensis TaxID=2710754 RepID=A0A9X4M286_9ACTN|nr:hypothetical protein [Rhodococcus sp. D2-41]MDG3008986.1 hypothetical protein [Rhodococcus sp. D2-41]MDG3015497.1 hypothetical protein [Corynebacteriales bacterium D3-21]